jgi:hypothetical protein
MPTVIAATFAFGVARVRIEHVPNQIVTRIALGPAQLRAQATQTVETRDAAIVVRLVEAAETTAASRDARRADLRYAIEFQDRRGRTQRVIYLDAFGTRGFVDKKPVRFAGDALKRAIVTAFPALAE